MPLGSPRRPERDICPEDVADMQTPEMQEIAKAHGVHPALIALKWLIREEKSPFHSSRSMSISSNRGGISTQDRKRVWEEDKYA